MAMGRCRECGTEVSDQAKTCPKCGVTKPVKKTSLLVKLLAGFFGLAVLGNIVGGMNRASSSPNSSPSTSTASLKPAVAPPAISAPAPVATSAAVDPAAARAKVHKDAVQPYTSKGYPEFFAKWGAAGMKRVNELMPKAAEKAASSPECDRVDLVELSGNRSVPGKKIVFFVDCKNTRRFYIDENDLKTAAIPLSKQAKSDQFSNAAATQACESAIKAKLQNPLSFNRQGTSVYRAPTGNVVVEFVFEAKNDLGGVLPSKARCVTTDRGLEEAVISKQ